MKIKISDCYDRYKHFTKQSFDIEKCCQDLVDKKPFGNYPFYILAHSRTDDDGVTKRLIWQPRLTKPRAMTNSMLFKAYPGTDNIKVIWIIPPEELWNQYHEGNITQSKIVSESIHDYINNREKLESPESDDLTDSQIYNIYADVVFEKAKKELVNNIRLKQ